MSFGKANPPDRSVEEPVFEAPATQAMVSTTREVDGIELVAERLAVALARQLGQLSGHRGALSEDRIRAYEVTRLQLAGPSDDEADTLGIGAIISVTPPHPVVAGDSSVTVTIRNATTIDKIIFAGPDGTEVPVDVERSVQPPGGSDIFVVVAVPRDAVTGPLSAVTDVGILTYRKNLVVIRPDRQGGER